MVKKVKMAAATLQVAATTLQWISHHITKVIFCGSEFNASESIKLFVVCSGVEGFWKVTQIERGCNFV